MPDTIELSPKPPNPALPELLWSRDAAPPEENCLAIPDQSVPVSEAGVSPLRLDGLPNAKPDDDVNPRRALSRRIPDEEPLPRFERPVLNDDVVFLLISISFRFSLTFNL